MCLLFFNILADIFNLILGACKDFLHVFDRDTCGARSNMGVVTNADMCTESLCETIPSGSSHWKRHSPPVKVESRTPYYTSCK